MQLPRDVMRLVIANIWTAYRDVFVENWNAEGSSARRPKDPYRNHLGRRAEHPNLGVKSIMEEDVARGRHPDSRSSGESNYEGRNLDDE